MRRLARVSVLAGLLPSCLAAGAATQLSLPDDAAGPPSTTSAVLLSALPADGIQSIDVTFQYDADVVVATAVEKTPLSEPFTLTSNLTVPGIVRLSLFGTSPLAGTGAIAEIHFQVVGSPDQSTPLDLTWAEINEGSIPSTLDDGAFRVCAGAPAQVAGVLVSRTPLTTVSWTASVSERYDVASGTIAELRRDQGVAAAVCAADDVVGSSWTDPGPDPQPGAGLYYLVRAQSPCGTGTYGTASSGAPRAPTIDCP